MHEIGTLPGGTKSVATGINDSGQVVGASDAADGGTHPFLYDPHAGMKLLPTPGAGGQALAINDRGEVVGDYGIGGGSTRAFFWAPDCGAVDLNALIDPSSGWVLETAHGINVSGLIVGRGLRAGRLRPFALRLIHH